MRSLTPRSVDNRDRSDAEPSETKVDGRKTPEFRQKMRDAWAKNPARQQRWNAARAKRGVAWPSSKSGAAGGTVDPDFDEGI